MFECPSIALDFPLRRSIFYWRRAPDDDPQQHRAAAKVPARVPSPAGSFCSCGDADRLIEANEEIL
jgi:hypothetical protein